MKACLTPSGNHFHYTWKFVVLLFDAQTLSLVLTPQLCNAGHMTGERVSRLVSP